jgi:hypothetical protein
MDGVSGAAAGQIDDVNRILELATAQNLELAKKLLKASVEAAVGSELGKGEAIDVSA